MGPGQPEPSTCHAHPDKHFLPGQLTELASLGSGQAPAAGEKSPSSPPCGETGRLGFQTCVVPVQAEPLAPMWADRQAVCPASHPAQCPPLGPAPGRAGAGILGVAGQGAEPASRSCPWSCVSWGTSCLPLTLSGCTPSSWKARDGAAAGCEAGGGARGRWSDGRLDQKEGPASRR